MKDLVLDFLMDVLNFNTKWTIKIRILNYHVWIFFWGIPILGVIFTVFIFFPVDRILNAYTALLIKSMQETLDERFPHFKGILK